MEIDVIISIPARLLEFFLLKTRSGKDNKKYLAKINKYKILGDVIYKQIYLIFNLSY